jgi:hypothetical protein
MRGANAGVLSLLDSLHQNQNVVLAHKVISISRKIVFILKVIVMIAYLARDSHARDNQR